MIGSTPFFCMLEKPSTNLDPGWFVFHLSMTQCKIRLVSILTYIAQHYYHNQDPWALSDLQQRPHRFHCAEHSFLIDRVFSDEALWESGLDHVDYNACLRCSPFRKVGQWTRAANNLGAVEMGWDIIKIRSILFLSHNKTTGYDSLWLRFERKQSTSTAPLFQWHARIIIRLLKPAA